MKNTKFFCFGTLILFLFLNTVNSTYCYIDSCQDIRALAPDCTTVYLTKDLTVSGGTCISMGGQTFDLQGFSINSTYLNFNGGTSLIVYGTGLIKNGILRGRDSSSPPYTNYVFRSSGQTSSIVYQNMLFESSFGAGAGSYMDAGSGTGTTYFYDCNFTYNSSHQYVGGIEIYNNTVFNNVIIKNTNNIYHLPKVSILNNNLQVTFIKTQLVAMNNGLTTNGYTGTTINIYGLRLCSNTNYDLYATTLAANTQINNLQNDLYFDAVYGNYTLTGNAKRDCFEFNGTWNETVNETEETTNETDKICSTNYDDLSDFGLYDLTMIALRAGNDVSEIEKYAFKLKVQDRTLLNSMDVSNGTLCLKKIGSSFVDCKAGVHAGSMYDAMVDNLAGYNFTSIQQFKGSRAADFIDQYIMPGIYIALNTQMIARSYCNEYNNNCIPLVGCTCEGYIYEFPVSELESGDYAVYFDITNNSDSSCVYRIYQEKTYLGGALSQTMSDLGYSESPVTGGTEKLVGKKLVTEAAYKNIGSGDNCNITLTTIGTEGLKSQDILFYLTANTTTNLYSEGEVIEQKLAIYDVVNKNYYQVFDLCSAPYENMTSVGHFWRIRDAGLNEWVAAVNNGYIGTTNKTVGGGATEFYYYYNETNIMVYNTSTPLSSSDVALDKYWTQPPSSDWTTYLIYALIGVFAIMVFYVIAMMFTKKSK